MNKREKLLMAAVAGITLGVAGPGPVQAEEKAADVHCWGVNSCGSHAKCSVTSEDIDAFKALLGEKEFGKYSKTEVHSCGSHAKCGASQGILNWTPLAPAACKEKGGYLVEEIKGKKVARKA